MNNPIPSIQISNDVIEPIVRAQLQASIAVALGKSDEILAQVVHTHLHSKVDEQGKPSSYNSSKPLITWMSETAIKDAAKEAIKDWFADNREKLRDQIKKTLSKNISKMAESFALGMCEQAKNDYRINVKVDFPPYSRS